MTPGGFPQIRPLRIVREPRRRGIAAIVALALFGVFVALAGVLAVHAATALRLERRALAEVCAAQALLSAREWAEAHPGEVRERAVVLPLDAVLPRGGQGTVELQAVSGPGGLTAVHCRIRLNIGRDSIRRTFVLPGDGTR